MINKILMGQLLLRSYFFFIYLHSQLAYRVICCLWSKFHFSDSHVCLVMWTEVNFSRLKLDVKVISPPI